MCRAACVNAVRAFMCKCMYLRSIGRCFSRRMERSCRGIDLCLYVLLHWCCYNDPCDCRRVASRVACFGCLIRGCLHHHRQCRPVSAAIVWPHSIWRRHADCSDCDRSGATVGRPCALHYDCSFSLFFLSSRSLLFYSRLIPSSMPHLYSSPDAGLAKRGNCR